MKLIDNARRAALEPASQQPAWVGQIAARFGTIEQWANRWNVQTHLMCDERLPQALADIEAVPTLTRAVRTYGADAIARWLNVHVTATLIEMGEQREWTPQESLTVAAAIATAPAGRGLSVASVMAFFHRLKCGEFEIYGRLTPRKLVEAWQKYAAKAREREDRLLREMEHERKAAAEAAHQLEVASAEDRARHIEQHRQWCAEHGYVPLAALSG